MASAETPESQQHGSNQSPESGPVSFFVPVDTRVSHSDFDIIDLTRLLWSRRYLICGVALLVGIIAVAASFLLPNVYRAQVLMAPAVQEDDLGALGDLGGLASLAGVTLPGSGNQEEDLAILTSRGFLWEFVDERNLLPVLFEDEWDAEAAQWIESDEDDQPSRWDAYRLLSEDVLNVSTDRKTGLVTVSVDWTDPGLAAEWANALVAELNSYLRETTIERSESNLDYLRAELERTQVAELSQTLYRLIAKEQRDAMLANTQQEFAFRILDPAAAPDRKVRPSRALIGILTTFLVGLAMVAFVIGRYVIQRASRENAQEPT